MREQSKKYTIAVYARIASAEQNDTETDRILLQCQAASLRTFAETFNWHVTGEFSDRCDGLGVDRPQLNAMIRHVADGRAEAVIIKDEGRLGRGADVVEKIERKIRAHGGIVFYADRLQHAMERTMQNQMCGSRSFR